MPQILAGIVTVSLFGVAWIPGITATIATALHKRSVVTAATAVGLLIPGDGLRRGALYALEPVAILAAQAASPVGSGGNPFSVAAPPTPAFLAWSLLWPVCILSAATIGFAARDV